MEFLRQMVDRFFENLLGRVNGEMSFRLVMQPIMATFFAFRSGLRDARRGGGLYFWALFRERGRRRELLRDGWRDISRVFFFALLLDVVYQLIVLRWIYPLEAVVTATFLALLPYLVIRGCVNWVARHVRKAG